MQLISRIGISFCCLASLALTQNGCSTSKAEKALGKPTDDEPYAGFSPKPGKDSERKIKPPDAITDDTEAEKAVGILVERLQSQERGYAVPAEDELRYWATKQGVSEIIVRKVRLLLQHPRIEVRAPVLRLTITFGKKESTGDLIEVLADEEYGMRSTAFRAIKARTGRDFGYNPASGDLARAKSLQSWRKWWQDELDLAAGKSPEAPARREDDSAKAQKPGQEGTPPADETKAGLPPEVLLPPPKDAAPQ